MTEPKCKTCRDSHPFCSACGSPDFVGFPELTPPPASDVEGLLAEAREQAGVAGSFRELINNLADALGQMSAEQSRLYAYFEQKRDERNEFAERVRTAETALRDAEDARVERERNVKVALDTGAKALERVTADLDRERAARVKAEAFKAYVHKRLDDAGVEKSPVDQHAREGCRIGGRLDIVFAELDTLRAQLDAVTRERDEAREDNKEFSAEEQGRWQQAIYELCCECVKGLQGVIIDGSGCDSGDPLELSLAEIRLAINAWNDEAYEARKERDAALARAEAAEKALAELGPVKLEVNGGEGWGDCSESTFKRLSEKGWMKRRVRVVKEHPNA